MAPAELEHRARTLPGVGAARSFKAALDSKRSSDVMHLFRSIAREQGAAVVVVTHDDRALDAFDVLYAMEDGVLQRTTRDAPALAAGI
jgi:putative ABC transport system ATP-binding protein